MTNIIPKPVQTKIYKTGQTRGADDDVIYQNRVGAIVQFSFLFLNLTDVEQLLQTTAFMRMASLL